MNDKRDQVCDKRGEECADRKQPNNTMTAQPHLQSNIKKVFAVMSGKGGVGKSVVTSMLAVTMKRRGYNAAILDADITGPSIPKAFGLKRKVTGNENGLLPVVTQLGIQIMSINLLLEHDTDPVIWRGPIMSNTVKQFWTDVIWDNVDYMFIDMPPGTGDIPLTVFQSIRVDGIILVTSPQELVSMIVSKAVKMAEMMKVPLMGIIENMAYFRCPKCHEEHRLFGVSHLEKISKEFKLPVLSRLPIDPILAEACDNGMIEQYSNDWFLPVVSAVEGFH